MQTKPTKTAIPFSLMTGLVLLAQWSLLPASLPWPGTISVLICTMLALVYGRYRWHKAEENRRAALIEALEQGSAAQLAPSPEQQALQQLLERQHQELAQLHHRLDELTRSSQQDPLTQLANRQCFRRDITHLLQEESGTRTAILVLIRATALESVNRQRGFLSGDHYLKEVTTLIQRAALRWPAHHLYRISGSDFAVLIHDIHNLPLPLIGRDLKLTFDLHQQSQPLASVACSGITTVCSQQPIEAILSRADLALARAQTGELNGWSIQLEDEHEHGVGEQQWRQVIERILEQERITLSYQPIARLHGNLLAYYSVYPGFYGEDESMLAADSLFAMAQRLDLLMRLTQLVIRHLIREHKTLGAEQSRWGIALSPHLLHNSAFLIWLEYQLVTDPDTAAHLVFELDEESLSRQRAGARRLFELLRRCGSRSAICNFGQGIRSFSLFQEIKPDYLKLDPALLLDLEQDGTNQQFVRMIVEMAHRMGSQVIAEGVEQSSQKALLESLYVDGLQGHLIAHPSATPTMPVH
ncbi:EAL domain-containing protein [Aeromonas bivalvium]|uniref:EAL domain-containing protein n=1 Tax=Aeromonas bivalvium TaxID=440079 RepID=UPI0005A760DA|nr:EAL domain-containing protein [Aeromonas bivalvium]